LLPLRLQHRRNCTNRVSVGLVVPGLAQFIGGMPLRQFQDDVAYPRFIGPPPGAAEEIIPATRLQLSSEPTIPRQRSPDLFPSEPLDIGRSGHDALQQAREIFFVQREAAVALPTGFDDR